jgi:integrase
MLYSGVRQGELRDLKKEDVHLEERFFSITKSKTPAGIRNVPIHDRILTYFEQFLNRNVQSEYIFTTTDGQHLEDHNFRDAYFVQVLDHIGMKHDHLPHDTRHTFISRMTEAGVDDRIIRKIVGHAGKGVTENVYTHIDMSILLDAINRI